MNSKFSHSKPGPPPSQPREAPLGDHPRHVACRVLARQARLFPEFDLMSLERLIEAEGASMSDLDRAFTHAIYDAAVRNWLPLTFLLSRCTSQPFGDLEPRLRGVMMAAAAQIIILDRVPVHSAINHAVEWAKRVIRPGAGGMTNAVLRKVAAFRPTDDAKRIRDRFTGQRDELLTSSGSAIVLSEPLLPEDELERLALATSHPIALLRHWLGREPMREVRRLATHGACQPPVILNTTHAKSLPQYVGLSPHSAAGHHVFSGSPPALRAILAEQPSIWVQDPASALGVQSVADLKPSIILDLCAGQGTKTRQLAATFPSAEIIATDVDETRFNTLAAQFKGSPQVKVVGNKKLREEFIGKADLVLLDVPCSNTGVLPRRPEARYRFGEETLKSLVSVQKQIIADTILLLREAPRGKILYSTCSLEPQENQEQALWTDRWHNTGISREHKHRPEGQPGEPGVNYCDASYAVLLG